MTDDLTKIYEFIVTIYFLWSTLIICSTLLMQMELVEYLNYLNILSQHGWLSLSYEHNHLSLIYESTFIFPPI